MSKPSYGKTLTEREFEVLSRSKCPIPFNEEERIFALRQTELLDSDADDPMFDRFATLAKRFFRVPIALISLIDIDRQWFKANIGLEGIIETHRDISFCAYTILPESPDVFVVPDVLMDSRFADNPLVVGPPYARFYAGTAIFLDDIKLGALAILDTTPRTAFSRDDALNLLDLSAAISNLVQDRKEKAMRSNKENSKMMVEMMRSLLSSVLSTNIVTQMLVTDQQDQASKAAAALGSAPTPLGCTVSSETQTPPIRSLKQQGDDRRTPDPGMHKQPGPGSSVTSSLVSDLEVAVGHLKVVFESNMCLSNLAVEKSDALRTPHPSFVLCDVLKTLDRARSILSNIEKSSKVVWSIETAQLSRSASHFTSLKAIYFVLLSMVERLIVAWVNIRVKIAFIEMAEEKFDSLEEISRMGELGGEGGGHWVRGLLTVQFEYSERKQQGPNEVYVRDPNSFHAVDHVLADAEGGSHLRIGVTGSDPLCSSSSTLPCECFDCWIPCAILLRENRLRRDGRKGGVGVGVGADIGRRGESTKDRNSHVAYGKGQRLDSEAKTEGEWETLNNRLTHCNASSKFSKLHFQHISSSRGEAFSVPDPAKSVSFSEGEDDRTSSDNGTSGMCEDSLTDKDNDNGRGRGRSSYEDGGGGPNVYQRALTEWESTRRFSLGSEESLRTNPIPIPISSAPSPSSCPYPGFSSSSCLPPLAARSPNTSAKELCSSSKWTPRGQSEEQDRADEVQRALQKKRASLVALSSAAMLSSLVEDDLKQYSYMGAWTDRRRRKPQGGIWGKFLGRFTGSLSPLGPGPASAYDE